jgi:hypothetical protein
VVSLLRELTDGRGQSGAVRRLPFRSPEHLSHHWLLLLVADRVDVVASRLSRGPGRALVGALAACLAGRLALRRRRHAESPLPDSRALSGASKAVRMGEGGCL